MGGSFNNLMFVEKTSLLCSVLTLLICKIYGKIIGKHGITKFDYFFTKLLIGFKGTVMQTEKARINDREK